MQYIFQHYYTYLIPQCWFYTCPRWSDRSVTSEAMHLAWCRHSDSCSWREQSPARKNRWREEWSGHVAAVLLPGTSDSSCIKWSSRQCHWLKIKQSQVQVNVPSSLPAIRNRKLAEHSCVLSFIQPESKNVLYQELTVLTNTLKMSCSTVLMSFHACSYVLCHSRTTTTRHLLEWLRTQIWNRPMSVLRSLRGAINFSS